MGKAEDFLDWFNKIDKFIKESEAFTSQDTFSYKLKNSKNKHVGRFKEELLSLAELRNAIVHNPRINNEFIAEPHQKTVERIKYIYAQLTNPKQVYPTFKFEVLGAKTDDFINDILVKMNENSFSQFPVYDETGKVTELINTNTIARWLSVNLELEGTLMIENTKVKDLVPFIEFKTNYKFISMKTSVFEAYSLFTDQILNKGRNLDVLFITHNGTENERLLGLVTIEDIATEIKNS